MLDHTARSGSMTLSEIRATLKEIRVSPVKTLGQNFLHDQNLARWIVDQAQITAEDYVVEIGPGLGALTRFLLEKGAHDATPCFNREEIGQNRWRRRAVTAFANPNKDASSEQYPERRGQT